MIIIKNARIILPHTILDQHCLLIQDDKILDIVKPKTIKKLEDDIVIDADGAYCSPGFIDIHSDYIEHMAAPRSSSLMNLELAIYEFEKECTVHGITTMFHSLSLWDGPGTKLVRKSDFVEKLATIIDQSHRQLHLIHHRFHVRYEISNLDQIDLLYQLIDQKKVHLLSFMDHTPGQGQYRDIDVYRNYVKKTNNLTDHQIEAIVQERINAKKLDDKVIKTAIEKAHQLNIAVASHDDDSLAKIEKNHQLEIAISEFPITLEVAKAAKEKGMYTVVGAPNILLGGSHSGNLSAEEAIKENSADILCSDYYPAALLHSVFQLYKKGFDLPSLIKMLTLNPAKATKIDHITGSIEKGKKADLILIKHLPNGFEAITHVLVDGVVVMQHNYRV